MAPDGRKKEMSEIALDYKAVWLCVKPCGLYGISKMGWIANQLSEENVPNLPIELKDGTHAAKKVPYIYSHILSYIFI